MSVNIVEAVQSRLGTHSFNRIDVNASHQSETRQPERTDHAQQGAAAAVLVALYRFGKTDEGAATLAENKSGGDWLQTIFMHKDDVAAGKVAGYADITVEEARELMSIVADEAVATVHRNMGQVPSPARIKSYMASQRSIILGYLPAELEMGKLLNDPVLDDRTNKMKGPVSSFLHWIESLLAPGDKTNEEAFRRDDEFFGRKNS